MLSHQSASRSAIQNDNISLTCEDIICSLLQKLCSPSIWDIFPLSFSMIVNIPFPTELRMDSRGCIFATEVYMRQKSARFCLVDFVNIWFSFPELFNPSWELVYPLSHHMAALLPAL